MPRPSVPTRRADILAAARDVFNARGFAGTRMDDIARAVGLSKAALYLQFSSKEALFEALVTELIEAMLPQAAPADFGDLPAEAIKYVRRIEELIDAPVAILSTSPEREDTILVRNPFAD